MTDGRAYCVSVELISFLCQSEMVDDCRAPIFHCVFCKLVNGEARDLRIVVSELRQVHAIRAIRWTMARLELS